MAEGIPIQETYDEEMLALLEKWFPDKTSVKSRPVITEVIVEAPRGRGTAWHYTAVVTMFGVQRRVTVWVEHPGTAPYALAAALEARWIGVLGNQAALGRFD